MAIHIEYETELSLGIPVEDIICNVIDTALDLYECPYEAEVNVILTDNSSIAVINEEYRGLPKPTDVSSFPMLDYDVPGDFSIVDDLLQLKLQLQTLNKIHFDTIEKTM